MRPSGIAFRLIVIVALALVLVQGLAIVLLYVQRSRDVDSETFFPVPDQVSAIVTLLEVTPIDARPTLLRAVNTESLRLIVVTEPPLATDDTSPWLEDMNRSLREYLIALGGHEVSTTDVESGRARMWTPAPFRLVVALQSGEYAIIETRGGLIRRLLMPRLDILGASIVLLVVGLSAWGIWRETRPLRQLAAAADRFGREAEPAPLAETGARDLRGLIQAFNRMQRQISELLRGRTLLLASISHDLRTYLTRLRLRAEFIADEEQRDRAVRDLDEMVALIDDTLAYVRMGSKVDGMARIDLAALVRAYRAARDEDAGDVRLLALPTEPVPVAGNASALTRVVSNLIDNAVKYGGAAEVELEIAAGEAILAVHDRGPGIPESERERVFEPFYRLEQSRSRDTGGSGLGLAIAKQIVERHRGRIELADRPGGGLTIRVRLPLAKAVNDPATAPARPPT